MSAPAKDAAPATSQALERQSRSSVNKFIPLGLFLVLLLAMVLNTKFLSASEAEALTPKPFDAKTFVAENFDKTAATLGEKATDLGTVATAVVADSAGACTTYGVDLGSGSCAFAVTATGVVESADADWITVKVTGLPPDTTMRIPLGTALNGTPVRDAAGYKFADFPGQTQYQQVSNEFKAAIKANVLDKLDTAALIGKTITVVGAYSIPGPKTSFNVQPMKITEG